MGSQEATSVNHMRICSENEDLLKKKLEAHQYLQEQSKLGTGATWAEERKEVRRQRMREYWRQC